MCDIGVYVRHHIVQECDVHPSTATSCAHDNSTGPPVLTFFSMCVCVWGGGGGGGGGGEPGDEASKKAVTMETGTTCRISSVSVKACSFRVSFRKYHKGGQNAT